MYKVMLVDDEKLIIQGLLNIFDWGKLNLEVTNSSNNGKNALDKFINDPVDIIISDINMPQLDGLELIKKIKAINNKTKFVILSGYDEFSYAKKAIEYGVERYILKPIDEDELKSTLEKIVNDLDTDKNKTNKILNKQRILFQYLNGKISSSDLLNIKDYINLTTNNKIYIVSSITFTKKVNGNSTYSLYKLIKEIFKKEFEIVHRYDGQTILINSWDENEDYKDIKLFYEILKDRIISELNEEVFIAIGDIVDNIDDLEVSYRITNALKKYMLTEGTNICLDRHSLNYVSKNNCTFNKEIEEINKLIIEKNVQKLEIYIDNIFNDKNLNPKNIYDLSIKILFLINKTLEDFKLDRINKKYEEDSLSNTIIELCNENTRENVKLFIISEMKELIELMDNIHTHYSPVVQQVINVINENYYKELSLKTLAQKYNINSSYLGQIFTKEVGISFSEYLNKVKNTKAKELILNTNMKINDIAKSVGYVDTSYFYRKFKKYFGVCPSTLRNMKNY